MPWPNSTQDFFAILALSLLTLKTIITNEIKIDKKKIYIYFFILIQPFIQYILNIIVLKQDLFLSLLYINIFFLSIINGKYLKESKNEIIKLTIFFTIIGIFSFFIQILQWFDFYEFSLILKSSFLRPSANLGQPNNLATLFFISLFSIIYLYFNKKINMYLYFIGSFILIFGMALTQSRTSWVVFLLLLVLSFRRRELNLFKMISIKFIVFLILSLILPYKNILFYNMGLTLLERAGSDSSRLDIWKQVYLAIINRPFLGYGWNQTSVAQTNISLEFPLNVWVEYSHNIFLDFFIWVGIPLGLMIIIIIFKWLYNCFSNINTTGDLIIFFIIISFFVHCIFEFPFAYAYLLIPIGLFVGFLDKSDGKNILYINRFVFVIFFGLFFLSFMILTRDYILIKEKIEIYSSKYFIYSRVEPIKSQVKILDGLDINNDVLYLSDCYLLNKYRFEQLEAIFYRYPTNKNLTIYYRSSNFNNRKIDEVEKYMKWKYPNFNKSRKEKCNF